MILTQLELSWTTPGVEVSKDHCTVLLNKRWGGECSVMSMLCLS